jgi:ABC-2 type transport system ATP-binding protein
VGIVAALIGQPQIVVLDEPFENLDPTSQIRLKELIVYESKNKNTTFLISSHDLNHVTEICNRIVLMEQGKIIKDMKGGQLALVELEAYFNP